VIIGIGKSTTTPPSSASLLESVLTNRHHRLMQLESTGTDYHSMRLSFDIAKLRLG
jgi:hypothetical protein